MPDWYNRYRQGFHQEVYDELLAMQDRIYEPEFYDEALMVMRELMRRVRANIEQLIPRLHHCAYQFGKGGFWENFSAEEKALFSPIFRPPTAETHVHVTALELLAGTLPLSLKCWFEEVDRVNLIGLFPSQKRGDGPLLDPLYLESLEHILNEVQMFLEIDGWRDRVLFLAPDQYHKYGFSGAGGYAVGFPCKAMDAPFLDEPHQTTFVNYLRLCFRWGGFPGVERENRLTAEQLEFLTKDLLPF